MTSDTDLTRGRSRTDGPRRSPAPAAKPPAKPAADAEPRAGVVPPGPGTTTGRPDWDGTAGLTSSWNHSAPWRVAVHRRALMLHNDLARLPLEADSAADAERAALDHLLNDAIAARDTDVGLRKWWWGTEVERAWAALREVEERTLDLLPEDELTARATRAAAHADTYLKRDDKRLLHLGALQLEAARKQSPVVPTGLRPAIVEVERASHTEADRLNQEARFLRNRVLLASCLSVLFGGIIVALQRWLGDTSFIDLPDGWDGSPWKFVLIVMLLGSAGALFTAIPAMSRTPSSFGPFNLPLQQALLKIAFGPLVAVAGFAIASTDLADTGSPTTWPGVVLLAIVLGAGQQAVTRYVDQRASKILDAAATTSDDES